MILLHFKFIFFLEAELSCESTNSSELENIPFLTSVQMQEITYSIDFELSQIFFKNDKEKKKGRREFQIDLDCVLQSHRNPLQLESAS